MELIAGTVNVSPGFNWPTPTLSTSGTTVNLQTGVNYNLSNATISGGGINIANGASLKVDSMFHAGLQRNRRLVECHASTQSRRPGYFPAGSGGNISAETIAADGIVDLYDGTLSSSAMQLSIVAPRRLRRSTRPAQSSAPVGFRLAAPQTSLVLGVNFLNDSVLLPHQSVELMHWTNHTGTFDFFPPDSPYAGLSFQAMYADDQLDITASAMDGDANLDGVVDLLDLNALATNYGRASAKLVSGDFSGDGVVNMADFNLLAANFGQSIPLPANTPLQTLAPEPTYCVALMLPLVGTRRRRSSR